MPLIKVSPSKIGIALANLGFEQVRTYKGRFWKVADWPEKEIDNRLPGDEPEPLPFWLRAWHHDTIYMKFLRKLKK